MTAPYSAARLEGVVKLLSFASAYQSEAAALRATQRHIEGLEAEVRRLREVLSDIEWCRLPGVGPGAIVTRAQAADVFRDMAERALAAPVPAEDPAHD